MYLSRLEVRHLRNLTSVSISPSSGLNIIEGHNASGKTSLLESIHLLGLARSFRTLKTSNIVQHHSDSLTLYAEVNVRNVRHKLGLQRFRDNTLALRLNGETIHRITHLASLLPLQLITPESISLVTGSPKERRQFLDWTMFHVEHSFHNVWVSYQRALKQRNSLLRGNSLLPLKSWDEIVAEYGEEISKLRQKTLAKLEPHIHHYVRLLLPTVELNLEYRKGWPKDLSLLDALKETTEKDHKNRYTSVGPHRADVSMKTSSLSVDEILSRGQLKLFVCALRLAQMSYLRECCDKTSIALIDDLPSELDSNHRSLLLSLLLDLDTQIFVTTTDRLELGDRDGKEVKVFHVEHGEIKEVL